MIDYITTCFCLQSLAPLDGGASVMQMAAALRRTARCAFYCNPLHVSLRTSSKPVGSVQTDLFVESTHSQTAESPASWERVDAWSCPHNTAQFTHTNTHLHAHTGPFIPHLVCPADRHHFKHTHINSAGMLWIHSLSVEDEHGCILFWCVDSSSSYQVFSIWICTDGKKLQLSALARASYPFLSFVLWSPSWALWSLPRQVL